MPRTPRKRLGDLLVEKNMITQTQLAEALQAQTIYGGKIGTNLVELGYITETALTSFLSAQLNIPAANPEDFADIGPEVIQHVAKDFAQKHKLVPLKKTGKRLKVAITDPYDMAGIDELSFKTSLIVEPVIAPEILIIYALESYYGILREARYIKLSGVTSEEIRLTESLADGINVSSGLTEKPNVHPYPMEKLSIDLAKTESKEEIFNILLKYFEYYFKGLAIFIRRHNVLQGFVTQGFQIAKDNFRNIEIPLDKPSSLKDSVEKQVIWTGPINENEIENLLTRTLSIDKNQGIYLIPLLLNNQTISLLLCQNYEKSTEELPLKDFDIVAKKISYAFQIIFLKKRILSLNS